MSAWSALLSAFEEVRQVLWEQGVELGVKVLRKLAYRYAERARVLQQAGGFSWDEDETVQGRRKRDPAGCARLRSIPTDAWFDGLLPRNRKRWIHWKSLT